MPRGAPDWVANKVGVSLSEEWAMREGAQLRHVFTKTVAAGGEEVSPPYYVPDGKVAVVTDLQVIRIGSEGNVYAVLYNVTEAQRVLMCGGVQGARVVTKTPNFMKAGDEYRILLGNPSTAEGTITSLVLGYYYEI